MAARDVLMVGVIIFVFALGFFIINFSMNTMVDGMIGVSEINESASAVSALEGVKGLMGRLDYIVTGLFIGLVLALIITGWFIGGIPIFMFMYFIVVVIGVLISTVMSNVWETFTSQAVFGTTISAFPVANNLMLNLPIYMAVVGFIGIVVMFAKPYFQGQ